MRRLTQQLHQKGLKGPPELTLTLTDVLSITLGAGTPSDSSSWIPFGRAAESRQSGEVGLPLLFVGQHGLGDRELVGAVSPQHVLSHPGDHVQALLSCRRRSYTINTFTGSCCAEERPEDTPTTGASALWNRSRQAASWNRLL